MSEQGWKDFLAARVEGWVVLHGGAVAVFTVPSLGKAAQLSEALTRIPGIEGSGALLTLSDNALTIRLTRDVWKLEATHVELARAVSNVAREYGAVADPAAVQEVQIAIAAKQDTIHLEFWRAVLGYLPLSGDNTCDPLGHGSTVWMQEIAESKTLRHAMHIDVSVSRDHVASRLQQALAAGGRIVDDSHAPQHWTLSDKAGNRVCICAWPDGASKSQVILSV